LREVAGRFEAVDLGEELDAEGGAFLDTAAVMKCLDLVVTVDTAAAHLAGP
jgi:ADP-heptose:LPS heptosyltransferase